MTEVKPKSTHDRVVADYYRSTSAIGSVDSSEDFLESLTGLQRRLGSWLDVSGKNVVDLGSGTGQLCALAIEGNAKNVVGVNLSREENEYACRYVNAEFIASDIGDYLHSLQPGSVDCVFALNILEHLDKDKLLIVLEAVNRCLKSGGTLVAMVPNATSPFGSMTRYWDITHHNAFTPSSIKQLSRMAGFGEAVDFRECGPVPYAPISAVRYVLWQGIRMLIKGYLMIELASDKGGIYTADMLFRLRKGT
tara:strand:+ start:11776 stop:12525 length:750 start_codon:yes stop_codon:yes gene_type:complete